MESPEWETQWSETPPAETHTAPHPEPGHGAQTDHAREAPTAGTAAAAGAPVHHVNTRSPMPRPSPAPNQPRPKLKLRPGPGLASMRRPQKAGLPRRQPRCRKCRRRRLPAETAAAHAAEPAGHLAVDQPYGEGSAAPAADGSGPEGFTVKGNASSMIYHDETSPAFEETRAEVWFLSPAHAEAGRLPSAAPDTAVATAAGAELPDAVRCADDGDSGRAQRHNRCPPPVVGWPARGPAAVVGNCGRRRDPAGRLHGRRRGPRPLPPGTVPPASGGPATSSPAGSSRDGGEPTVAGRIDAELQVPWSTVFLPDGTAVISERDSALLRTIAPGAGAGRAGTLGKVPDVVPGGEGGLLGLALSPDFATDRYLYAYFTSASDNRIARLRLEERDGVLELGAPEVIFTGIPKAPTHNGGRIRFGPGRTAVRRHR